MFNCTVCNQTQNAKVSQIKVVTSTRERVYPARYIKDEYDQDVMIDSGGKGFETVREEKCCGKCAEKLTSK